MTTRTVCGLLAVSAAVAVLWARLGAPDRRGPAALTATVEPFQLLADGFESTVLRVVRPEGQSCVGPLQVTMLENPHSATVQEISPLQSGWQVRLRAGVLPGRFTLRAEAAGCIPAIAQFTTTLDTGDRESDGTPDVLRLDDDHDRQAFRRWFTYLAEAQFFQSPALRPGEISDCAALLRYAYREALKAHDHGWAASAHLPLVPALDSVSKYQYPFTPLGAALFRVRAGAFVPADLTNGAFAQFADARTLWDRNTYFVTRSMARALPGDLLFYRRESNHMPFHSMIYLGASRIAKDNDIYTLYHTGPDENGPGELRRVPLNELMRHPDPQWHPVESNPVFLGIYRWNILREAS